MRGDRDEAQLQLVEGDHLVVDAGLLDRHGEPLGDELEQPVSSRVNARGVRVPTCRTPMMCSRTASGTPSRDLIPFSRRSGLYTSA